MNISLERNRTRSGSLSIFLVQCQCLTIHFAVLRTPPIVFASKEPTIAVTPPYIYPFPFLARPPSAITSLSRAHTGFEEEAPPPPMAVQAPCPSNPFRAPNNAFEDQITNQLPAAYTNLGVQPPQILNGVLLRDPESVLTCYLSAFRKRNRDGAILLTAHQQDMQQTLMQFQSGNFEIPQTTASTAGFSTVVFERPREGNCLTESALTSTSGRSPPFVPPTPFAHDALSCFHRQRSELDVLIGIENVKLQMSLEESRKRHLRTILLNLEQSALLRLREKELELDSAKRTNERLEEMVKQMAAQKQLWSQMAKNSEAVALSLRSSLEQILLHGAITEEGYGDSSDTPAAITVDNARSRCDASKDAGQGEVVGKKFGRKCRACEEEDVSVLLLPCRHLCLCKECESSVLRCPICKASKNATLHILMS